MTVYALLFFEFFKIGLFALGGGLVTVPFLFDLSTRYPWFTSEQLVNMIAVAESSPGPVGVNMATYAGFKAAGVSGALTATFGLALPSLSIIVIIAALLDKFRQTDFFQNLMYAVRPAVIALILNAGAELGRLALTNAEAAALCAIFWGAIHFFKLHPILYIVLGGILGVALGL